jgi:DNA replication protein DnaC
LGREAIVAGYTVLFTPATTLVAQLAKAQSESRFEERLTHYAKPKLSIIDELDYLPFEPTPRIFSSSAAATSAAPCW